jgi:mannose-6-phosphate isomerase
MLYPYRFQPILVERVWGGDTLARYGKNILPGQHIGESWEISDRPDAQSVVANGALAGRTLHQLVETLGAQLLGSNGGHLTRFPLLIKLLDARERLSLQVHPPAAIAPKLKGEPKTEMWYILEADPGAHLIAGLQHGVTRAQFEQSLTTHHSPLTNLLHRFPVRAGDALFVPSGRLHAIDAGLVIVEIQQNSDTTYRVYDWGRTGRALHVEESLASINFNDFEPGLDELPVRCDYFRTELITLDAPQHNRCDGTTPHIVCCVAGEVEVERERLRVGEFALLPAALGAYTITPTTTTATLLRTIIP